MTETQMSRHQEAGFSLMEALVALLVIGIAGAGVARTIQSHIDSTRALEMRAAAQWVAENRLVELSLDTPLAVATRSDEAMLGQNWQVTTRLQSSEDPDLRQAIISVRAASQKDPVVTMRGFVDAGTVTP